MANASSGTSLSTRNSESTVMRHLLIDDRGQDLVEFERSGVRGAWRGMAGASGRSSGYPGKFGASDASGVAASMAEPEESHGTTATSFDSSATTKLAARLLKLVDTCALETRARLTKE